MCIRDSATGLSNCICKDGQTTITANLPMSGFAHTGVGNATARNQYAAVGQVQDNVVWCSTATGTGDVITITPSIAITSYAAGQKFQFIASAANTTNVTVNVSSLGAKALTKSGATALVASDIASGAVVSIQYDGTQFQLLSVNLASINSSITTINSSIAGGYVNKIRNPGMTIASRGTSGTITAGSPVYTLDGWILFSGTANITWSQSGTLGYPSLKSMLITGNTGVTATRIYQRIESNVVGYIDGQQVTIQALIINNTGASITPILSVDHANSIDNFGAVTNDLSVALQSIANGGLTRVAYTYTAASNSLNGLQISFDFGSTLNSVAKSVTISNVELRVTPGVAIGLNTLPPAIEVIDITAEKLRCARYLPSVFAGNTTSTLGNSFYATTTSSPVIIPFGVEARIAPTGIIASNAAHIQIAGAAVNTASNAITFSNAGLKAGTINVGQVTAATVGQGNVTYFNNASAYILFTGAEL